MKAAVFMGAGRPLAIETLADPEPGPDEMLIRIHRCGICGTELHMTSGHPFDFKAGMVLGHEYAGEVVETGRAVEGFRKGDKVTALPSKGCGRCAACRAGNPIICPQAAPLFGGFGEYVKVPAANALKLPDTLSLADGALVEPMAVGLHGARQAEIGPDDRVLVQGAGAVALTTIFWARRLGARRIVATSRAQRRAALALEMGADAFVQSGEDETRAAADALGGAPSVVFECVGVPGFLQKAAVAADTFGRVISMGFCLDPDALVPSLAAFKELRLRFPVGYTFDEFAHAAEAYDAGHADPGRMVSSVVSLGELPEVFETLRGPNAETKVHVGFT